MDIDTILSKANELDKRIEYKNIYESCNLREKKSPSPRPIRNSFYRAKLRHDDPKYKDDTMKNFNLEYDDFLGDFNEFEDLLDNFVEDVIEEQNLERYTFLDARRFPDLSTQDEEALNKKYRKYEGYLFKMIFTHKKLGEIYNKLSNRISSKFIGNKIEIAGKKLENAEKAIYSLIDSFISEIRLVRSLWKYIKNIFGEPLTEDYLRPDNLMHIGRKIKEDDLIRITNTEFNGKINKIY